MSYERDDAMRVQEAREEMIRMRTPPNPEGIAYNALMRTKEAYRAKVESLQKYIADQNREGMDLLADVPGETLLGRIRTMVGYYLTLQQQLTDPQLTGAVSPCGGSTGLPSLVSHSHR